MGLSEAEIEARLALLRRRREALDREIADLVLYLELGRRLAGTGTDAGETETRPETRLKIAPGASRDPRPRGPDGPPAGWGDPPPDVVSSARRVPAAPARPRAELRSAPQVEDAAEDTAEVAAERPRDGSAEGTGRAEGSGALGAIPPAIPFAEDAAGARRYGRALVGAACAALAEAGRPLHAAEILAVLAGRGFTVPGRDPVAALNTRLWKRAGPDGPLRRVGEATYALAPPA
ncbi:hypothetical protein ACLBX9_11990 [Methylobacterium sp. A49B]